VKSKDQKGDRIMIDTYGLSNIFKPSNAIYGSISAENPNGEKGGGALAVPGPISPSRELGQGWKVSPCISLFSGETKTLVDMKGPGMFTHIWITCKETSYRDCILRFFWDHEESASVEVPLGDFFCNGWGVRANVLSIPVNVNPSGGFNSYWPMPFRAHAKVTIENQNPAVIDGFFYQFDYILDEIPDDAMYFHAMWRRENPVKYHREYTIADQIRGNGRFAGVYLAWGQNNNGWWGEGEVKFYIDGDTDFPTYCGTGTEDYFGGAWGFISRSTNQYETFSAPFLGYHQLIKPDGLNGANMRHGMYRFHIADPVFFKEDFKATIQALGWRSESRYLPLQDDLASTAFWYQSEPHNRFPAFPERNDREVI
jgi:hypothetical protein